MLQAGESGSPPRVREKLNRQGSGLEMSGITPACAGKTHPSIKRQQDFKDHPRVCGKNFQIRMLKIAREGSPPRVREKRDLLTYKLEGWGITPACAGKT